MKKIINFIFILSITLLFVLINNVYAISLDNLIVETNKTIVRPDEEVKVTVNFGTSLGAYTFNFAYDNNLLEFVSADTGVAANDTGDKVKVTFFDSTGGTNPKNSTSIIFRGKSGITTSNPTEITVTGEGLSNADASVVYDDITTPIVKNITVEPQYTDYTFSLTHSGKIVKTVPKDMVLSYSSPMGRYYEHARLIAEATTPNGGKVTLIGIDNSSLEHDIIQSGWGDAQGYKIGGKDFSQVLNVKGTFTEAGEYTITLKLIDRDNSDSIISQKSFNFAVVSEESTIPPTTPDETTPPEDSPSEPEKPAMPDTEKKEEKPSTLPNTGISLYLGIISIIIMVALIIINKKNKKGISLSKFLK